MSEAATIELLAARAQISDVVYRYAQFIRSGRVDDCMKLFTADATFEVRQAVPGDASSVRTRTKASGHAAILSLISQSAAAAGVCPLIHNLLIDVNGSEATSSSVMTASVWSSGQTIVGEYQDSFRREGEWRFSARIYTIFRANL
jgi:SnoaL-like domain